MRRLGADAEHSKITSPAEGQNEAYSCSASGVHSNRGSRSDAAIDILTPHARCAGHEAGVKVQRIIKRTRQYLFVFVTNRDLPATNSGSERAWRPCAVFRKITNGSERAVKLFADIRSVIEPAQRGSIGALEAIRLTLAGTLLADSI